MNIFQDGGNVWTISQYSPGAALIDDATFSLTVEGTEGNDALVGGRGSDLIGGGAGDDTISVGLSNDVVRPGTGNNTIYLDGGFTNKVIFLGDEADYTVAHPSVGFFTYTNNLTGDATTIYHSNELNNQRIIFGGNTDECFPAGTFVALWGGSTKPIEAITRSDVVLTHDEYGNPVPGIVDKLFSNTTAEFVRLSFNDGREDLVSTPSHRFLTETGDYMEIGHMLRLGGGTVRLTDTDGSIVEATGEVIIYSAETAHMFEQSAQKTIAFQGNNVLKEDVEQGWQTYNFEVREHHNYVAGGIRVHNDSILSTLQAGDQLVALNDDLTDMAVLRDVSGDGTADFVAVDGYRRNGEPTEIALEHVYYWNGSNGDLATLLSNVVSNGPDAASNVFDPGNGNNWNDGTWGDDIEEAFFADVVGKSDSGTPDRSVIEGYYNATFFADVDISSLASAGDVLASPALITKIKDAASSPDDAAGIAAWLLGIEEGTLGYTLMVGVLGGVFDDVPVRDGIVKGTSSSELINASYSDIDGDAVSSGADDVRAYSGHDTVDAGAGDDTIRGGNGNDLITGGSGNDWMNGDAGLNTAVFSVSRADNTIARGANNTTSQSAHRSRAVTLCTISSAGSLATGAWPLTSTADGTQTTAARAMFTACMRQFWAVLLTSAG